MSETGNTKNVVLVENDTIINKIDLFAIQQIEITELTAKKQGTYWDNGKLKISVELKDGIMHGVYEEYYENGQLKLKEKLKKGKKTGNWKAFDNKGRLLEEKKYSNYNHNENF